MARRHGPPSRSPEMFLHASRRASCSIIIFKCSFFSYCSPHVAHSQLPRSAALPPAPMISAKWAIKSPNNANSSSTTRSARATSLAVLVRSPGAPTSQGVHGPCRSRTFGPCKARKTRRMHYLACYQHGTCNMPAVQGLQEVFPVPVLDLGHTKQGVLRLLLLNPEFDHPTGDSVTGQRATSSPSVQ